MPRVEKVKINVKERLEDNTLDLSMSNLTEVPIKDIVSILINFNFINKI